MDRNEALALIRLWQLPVSWNCALEAGQKRKKHQASAHECWRIARDEEGASKETWQSYAKTEEHGAEAYWKAIMAAGMELERIKQYLRENSPTLLPLIPIIDFFEEHDADCKQLALSMVKLEGELLAIQREAENALPPAREKSAAKEDSKADNSEKSAKLPRSEELAKLALKLRREYRRGETTKIEIATKFCNGNKKRANNILRQLRNYPSLLQGTDADT